MEPTLRAGEYTNRATLRHQGPELYPRQSGFHFHGSYRNLYEWFDPNGIIFLVAGRDPLLDRFQWNPGRLFCTGELMLLAPLHCRSETLRIHGVYKTVPAGRTYVPETYRLDEIRKGGDRRDFV